MAGIYLPFDGNTNMNYIEQVYNNVNIEEGYLAIENMLLEVYFNEGISSKELARKTLLPVPLVAAIKKEFIKVDVLIQDRGIRLSKLGRAYVEEQLGYRGLDIELYNKLINSMWDIDKDFKLEKEILEKLFNERPQVDVTIDQSKCTVETSIKRAILCLQYHSLVGKTILCLGDDDLVSISLGFILKRLFSDIDYCNTKICVFDVDQRFLDYISAIAKQYSLPITCIQTDLRHPIDKNYMNKFDCAFTDPPYTIQGINLFVSRAITALKSMKGLPIFLSFAHKSPNFTLEMQGSFVLMGLGISEIVPRFNRYEGAEIIGNSGQMIVLKTTDKTTEIIENEFEHALYTGELKRTLRSYKCKKCGEVIKVGFREEYKTIEELKKIGCPKCREGIFDLVNKEDYPRENS